MTNTSTGTRSPQAARTSATILMALMVAMLAPMFLGVTGGNMAFARLAAIDTINAYRGRNQSDFIAIAQIIAFGLAALGSLSLSMDDDISLNMALHLRGNANALNRSAEQNRRALAQSQARPRAPVPETELLVPEPEVIAELAAAREVAAEAEARHQTPAPAAESQTKRDQEMWAIAMIKEASELTASLPNLPPSERKNAELQAGILSATAHDLLYGPQGGPGKPHPGAPGYP